MTQYRSAVAGDVGDTRIVTLDGVNDLTTVTAIQAHVWQPGLPPVTLAASVLSAVARTVTVNLGGVGGWLSTAEPGTYRIEIQVAFGSTVLTWPNGQPDTIAVRAQGD